MECRIIHERIAQMISQLLAAEIPAGKIELENISSSCGNLSFEGTNCDSKNLEKYYKFKFCWYDENWNIPLDKIHTLENYLREAVPETHSDGNSNFYTRYYKINSSKFNRVNISGMIFYCAELNFSVIY